MMVPKNITGGGLGCLGGTTASETYVSVESRSSSCRFVVRLHILHVVVHVAHARFAADDIVRRRVTFTRRHVLAADQ